MPDFQKIKLIFHVFKDPDISYLLRVHIIWPYLPLKLWLKSLVTIGSDPWLTSSYEIRNGSFILTD